MLHELNFRLHPERQRVALELQALSLIIDPFAELAETQEQIHRRLLELTQVESEELRVARQAATETAM